MESDSAVPLEVKGLNQSLKLIRAKRVVKIFLASDADDGFISKVMNEIGEQPIELDSSLDSFALAEKFKNDVPCGIVSLYK